MEIKVGDFVFIDKDSYYYVYGSETNPVNMLGQVYIIEGSFGNRIFVKWKNNRINSYNEFDLLVLKSPLHKFLWNLND